MSELKLYLFGPPRLEHDSTPVGINRRKALALLIYLAINKQPHSRDALATLFYPDYDQSRARTYLRRDLAVLNAGQTSDWVDADRETIELKQGTTIWSDVDRFRQCLADVAGHDHAPTELCADCLALLTEAVTLYSDDFLAGFTLRDCPEFDDWQFFQMESLRQELATALERLIGELGHRQQVEAAIPYARRWVALDPLHEPAQHRLIQLYADSGQPAAALRHYDEYIELLEVELGIPPGEEIATLYEAIKAKRIFAPFMKAEEQARAKSAKPALPSSKPDQKAQLDPAAASRPLPAPARPDRPAVLAATEPGDKLSPQSIPLVGRENEYGQLMAALEQAGQGRGQMVLIAGEPGIGKSRLVREVLRNAQVQDLNILWHKCYESEQTMPYQVLIDLVTQMLEGWPAETFRNVPPSSLAELAQLTPEIMTLFPNLPSLPPELTDARQARLFRALQQFLLAPAEQGLLALVVDDIHWADHVTLQFLSHLARFMARQPMLLICTYRTEKVAVDTQLTSVIQLLQRESHALHLLLTRLSLEAANALVKMLSVTHHTTILGQWLHQETDGNPFFLVSILQSLKEQGIMQASPDTGWRINFQSLQRADDRLTLPDALRQTVLDRLRRVPRPSLHILEVAAVYGRRFDFATLQAITGENTMALLDVLEELMARQLLREEKESQYDFSHDKIREVVYHDLSRARSMLLHRQVAEAIEASDLDRVAILAEHFEKGELWNKAIIYFAQAAGRSRHLFAMQEALGFYDRAIALAERHVGAAPSDLLLDLYEQRGETRGLMGGHAEEAVADLLLVLNAVRDRRDQHRERIVLIRIGQVYRYGDRYSEALDYLKAALEVARRTGDEPSVADALYHLGSTVWSQGYNDQALAYHQEAVEICQRLGLTDLVAVQAYHGLGEAYFLAGRAAEAIDLYEISLDYSWQIQDRSYESENLGNMGMALQIYGIADYERAKEVFTRSLKISQSANLEWHAAQVLGPLGLACGLSGNYQQALDYLNQSLSIAESIGARRFQSLLLDMTGAIWQELNHLERAKAAHEQALELAQEADAGWWLPRIRANLAIDTLRLGELTVAETLQTTFEEAMQRQLKMHAVRCLEGLTELALAQDNPAQALEYADQLQHLAEPGGMREIVAEAHRWRGQARLALGELAAAADELEQALTLAQTIGRPRLEWACHVALAALSRKRGDEAAAADHEARGQQIITGLFDQLTDAALRQELHAQFGVEPSDEPDVPDKAPPAQPAAMQPSTPAKQESVSLNQRFRQGALIARGGMGDVYEGHDTDTGQRVAIKRLKPEFATHNTDIMQRLIREGEILRQLNHPNIVKMLAMIESLDSPVVIMEYVPGGSLSDVLKAQPPMALEQILNIGLELADALARVHHVGIIHRDIKPANVLLAEDGTPRLTDFGVAHLAEQESRLTQEGDILGTTVYMSPEAWCGEELDARSDIWSFGAVLYEMVAGQPPFAARQIAAIVKAILNDPVPDLYRFRPDTPPLLVGLINQMLVKDRTQRLDSMRQVAAGLEVIQRSLTLPGA